MNTHSKLFLLAKKYQILNKTDRDSSTDFGKLYEYITTCLIKGKNLPIQNAIKEAIEEKDDNIYDLLTSLTLTSIHRFNYSKDNKEYCSTLFIVPYLTAPLPEDNNQIHYPPLTQVEDIFKKHFLQFGLIDDMDELKIAGIKIDSETAYNLNYSDWYEIHKQSLLKTLQPSSEELYEQSITLNIPSEGELNFFPLLITYEDSEFVKEPKICDCEQEVPMEDLLNAIEKDVSLLSGTGVWILGVPSHCENALNFGLELQQDFELDIFFREIVNNSNIEVIICPSETSDLILSAWNNKTHEVEQSLFLNYYSDSDEEFVDNLLQLISFYEIPKTYIFEDEIDYDKEDYKFDIEEMSMEKEVVILEKDRTQKPTFH